MTTKQFNWLKENQPVRVYYFRVYKGKEPKNYHPLRAGKIAMEMVGNRFYFTGTYHTWDGRKFIEHYARYNIHYKNIRVLKYSKE